VTAAILKMVERKKGILLDVSFGGEKQERSIALRPGGDVNHRPTRLPFPLPSSCVHTAVVTHVLEYVVPEQFFAWWNELHRIMQPGGIVYCSGPYGGDESHGWLSDPEHRTRIVEQSFAWLDPRTPIYEMHASVGRKQPLPWYPLTVARVPGPQGTLSYNVTLQKPVPPKRVRVLTGKAADRFCKRNFILRKKVGR
jgi:hypothetical protein